MEFRLNANSGTRIPHEMALSTSPSIQSEERKVLVQSFLRFPLEDVRAAATGVWKGTLITLNGHWSIPEWATVSVPRVEKLWPSDVAAVLSARQIQGPWHPTSNPVRTWGAVVALFGALVTLGRYYRTAMAGFSATALVTVPDNLGTRAPKPRLLQRSRER
jgi:hypothetical protein